MDEDYVALIALVGQKLREAGLGDIADESRYGAADPDSGEFRLDPPAERLDQMLEAFERHLNVRDRRTVQRDIEVVNAQLEFGQVKTVEIVPAADTVARDAIRLDEGADLREPYESVRKLRTRLRHEGLGDGEQLK